MDNFKERNAARCLERKSDDTLMQGGAWLLSCFSVYSEVVHPILDERNSTEIKLSAIFSHRYQHWIDMRVRHSLGNLPQSSPFIGMKSTQL
jgi:hypothetical protein